MTFTRPHLEPLLARLREPRRFIQVLAGPRQVGKTTLARQAMAALGQAAHYASADEPTLRDRTWLVQQWEAARLLAREAPGGGLLVLDEVQKIGSWSETVKALWDQDTASGRDLRVAVLGSAPLLLQRGLTESLAGRFEILRVPHWSWPEMRDAFGWDLERFLWFGGYPGAAPLADDEPRWAAYVRDALVETTVSRDVLLLTRVDKPALLRRLLDLACAYSGQVLSYNKMLGQLQDAGNTTTLAHYLDLLDAAGMAAGLSKYAAEAHRQRGSSPKLQVCDTSLLTALSHRSRAEARRDPEFWGRLVESAVGAHLLATARGTGVEVSWWRERTLEVDFVLSRGSHVAAIEVKSGRRRALPGMKAFEAAFHPTRLLLVGADGIPLETFLSRPAEAWLVG